MKNRKFLLALGRAIGLGSAAVYVASAGADPVDAGCVKCRIIGQYQVACDSGSLTGGSGCSVSFGPDGQPHCRETGSCTS